MRTRKPVNPVNRERRSRLSEVQWGPESFQRWLHGLACVIPGCAARDVEAAHSVSRGAGGTWKDIVPLCRDHHREQHTAGLVTFEQRYGIDLRAAAATVQRRWREIGGEQAE